MTILLALGLHGLLMALYALLIHRRISRLLWTHWLLALCVPFVGECCLLAAEMGGTPAVPRYTSPFLRAGNAAAPSPWTLPDDWQARLEADEGAARAFLLEVIRHAPAELVTVLQTALRSPNSEVSHIAAASLMKQHQRYESELALCEARCREMPNNAQLLRAQIMAVRAYRVSGLNDPDSVHALAESEIALLGRYLSVRTSDQECHAELELLLRDHTAR